VADLDGRRVDTRGVTTRTAQRSTSPVGSGRCRRSRRRPGLAVAAAAGLLVLTACAAAPDASTSAGSHEYLPGLAAHPHVPDGVSTAPVVVMVPGGSWQSADPSGLQPLAEALAARGVFAMPVVIRASEDGVAYPVPVEDIVCAVADGVATARSEGIEPERVVLLGHSSGAHLSAVATLDPERYSPDCPDPAVVPDALVGLAGPHDIRQFADPASVLFEEGADAAQQEAANPVLLAVQRPEVPVLLLHGEDDDVVPTSFSTDFGTALTAAGHPTTVRILPGEDHQSIYSAETAAGPVAEWLEGLP
jgi:acetyl esterase/lipase